MTLQTSFQQDNKPPVDNLATKLRTFRFLELRATKADMKPHHAAALALVGWYLMMPPIRVLGPANDPKTRVLFDSKAPLSEWEITVGFDTAKECYDYPDHMMTLLRQQDKDPNSAQSKEADATAQAWLDKAKCIATDDPRIKGMKPRAK